MISLPHANWVARGLQQLSSSAQDATRQESHCLRTQRLDLYQEYNNFFHDLDEDYCGFQIFALPLHRQKLIDCFRLVVIFIVLGF